MAPQPSSGLQGFGQRPKQGEGSNAGSGRPQEPHTGGFPSSSQVPAPLVRGHFGQGMRPGGLVNDTARGWVPTGPRSTPGATIRGRGINYGMPTRGQGMRPGRLPSSGHEPVPLVTGPSGQGMRPESLLDDAPRSWWPEESQVMLARGRGMRARDQGMRPGGFPSSGHVPVPLVPGRFDQGMRPGGFPSETPRSWPPTGGPSPGEPTSTRRSLTHMNSMLAAVRNASSASDYTPPSDYETNKRKRPSENLDPVTDTSRWVKALKKRPNTAASEELAAASNPTQASGQNPDQGIVVKSEVEVLISATSTGLSDNPASPPTSPTSRLGSESLVVLDMPSRPDRRCPPQSNCKASECAQREPRSVLAASSFLCAKSKTTVGDIAIQSNASDNCFRTNS